MDNVVVISSESSDHRSDDDSLPENIKLVTNLSPGCRHYQIPASSSVNTDESASGGIKPPMKSYHSSKTQSISSSNSTTSEDNDLADFAWITGANSGNTGISTITATLDIGQQLQSSGESEHLKTSVVVRTTKVNDQRSNSSNTSHQDSERFTHALSDSDDDIPNFQNHGYNYHGLQPRSSQAISLARSDSSDSQGESVPSLYSKKGDKCSAIYRKRKSSEPGLVLTKKELAEKRRQEVKAEKEKKKIEQAQAKALKQASLKMKKVYKLEECLNYLTAVLDCNLFDENFGGDLKCSLQELNVKYQTRNQIYPMTITWKREIPLDDCATKSNEEAHVLLIIPSKQAIELVMKNNLCAEVQAAQAHFTDMKLSLILHGTEQYLRPQKKGKATKDISQITREDLTEALVEVQILAGCSHRFAESSMEIAMMIAQFSKAVAEIPYRLEKSKKEKNKLDWFGDGDNRDCVRVDKNGLGLQRLWRQQLCEFNLAGLQISEAITAVYHSPQALFEAYEACCSQNEAEKLLQDIPIRRNVGALSSARRIGPELSKKIHEFFNSMDGTGDVSVVQD